MGVFNNYLSLTALKMGPVKGQLTDELNVNVNSYMINPESEDIIGPGTAVKLLEVSGREGQTYVDKAAPEDAIWGFVKYEVKRNLYSLIPGRLARSRIVQVCSNSSHMWMELAADTEVGVLVEVVSDGDKIQPVASGIPVGRTTISGKAGELVSVKISVPTQSE